jgi:predicted murein hydrolase (TIGR00659 family)
MNEVDLGTLWVYLSTSPLLGLVVTLLAYILSCRLYEMGNRHPLLNPVALAMVLLILLLMLTGTPYSRYFEGAQFVHFLLGPATVALAVPLYQQFSKLRELWSVVLLTILAGVLCATLSAVGVAWLLGASAETLLSLAPKSVTTPVAMGISETIGGLPSLTAVMVVVTGILGAIFGTRIFDLLGIEDDSVRGVAMGVAAHGIGTARAFQVSTQMGAFSGLAMALSALATALLLPWVLKLLGLI